MEDCPMKPTPNSPEAKAAVSVAAMRASDAYTIAHFVPGRELMHRAAQGIFDAAAEALAPSGGWHGKKVAIVAGSGSGLYPSLPEAVEHMVKITARYEPNMENHKLYEECFCKYVRLYDALCPIFELE